MHPHQVQPSYFVFVALTLVSVRFEPRRLSLVYSFSKNMPPATMPGHFKILRCAYILRAVPVLGGACRDRTDDPLLAKQVLSQLS